MVYLGARIIDGDDGRAIARINLDLRSESLLRRRQRPCLRHFHR